MLKCFAEKKCEYLLHIRILYIESAKNVNEMTLNELVKLTTFEQLGPVCLVFNPIMVDSNGFLFNCMMGSDSMMLAA